ncbi:MAG: hypothetical protein D6704_06550 [Nitrospirae bacterium]|nr:MAG: hypothetical protein D6704_06550 [Nitrospirota bacterium]
MVFFLTACTSTPPRYPEDHARFERIVEAVETLRRAYEQRDEAAIHDLALPLQEVEQLEQEIARDFSTFSTITLTWAIDRITIKGDLIFVAIHWDGIWNRPAAKQPIHEAGHGILIWSGTQVILWAGVEGDVPFGIADRLS